MIQKHFILAQATPRPLVRRESMAYSHFGKLLERTATALALPNRKQLPVIP